MKDFLQHVDWVALVGAVWSAVLIPVGKQVYEYLKSKRLDGYAVILYEEVKKAVKALYQEEVLDLKGRGGFTPDKAVKAKALAKAKAVQALPSSAYRMLREDNDDFDLYLSNLIESAVYDIKYGGGFDE